MRYMSNKWWILIILVLLIGCCGAFFFCRYEVGEEPIEQDSNISGVLINEGEIDIEPNILQPSYTGTNEEYEASNEEPQQPEVIFKENPRQPEAISNNESQQSEDTSNEEPQQPKLIFKEKPRQPEGASNNESQQEDTSNNDTDPIFEELRERELQSVINNPQLPDPGTCKEGTSRICRPYHCMVLDGCGYSCFCSQDGIEYF